MEKNKKTLITVLVVIITFLIAFDYINMKGKLAKITSNMSVQDYRIKMLEERLNDYADLLVSFGAEIDKAENKIKEDMDEEVKEDTQNEIE